MIMKLKQVQIDGFIWKWLPRVPLDPFLNVTEIVSLMDMVDFQHICQKEKPQILIWSGLHKLHGPNIKGIFFLLLT